MSGPQPGDLLPTNSQWCPDCTTQRTLRRYWWKWFRFTAWLPSKYSDALDPRLEPYVCFVEEEGYFRSQEFILKKDFMFDILVTHSRPEWWLDSLFKNIWIQSAWVPLNHAGHRTRGVWTGGADGRRSAVTQIGVESCEVWRVSAPFSNIVH